MSKVIAKLLEWYQHPVNEIVMLCLIGSCLLMLMGLALIAFLAADNVDIFNFTSYRQR